MRVRESSLRGTGTFVASNIGDDQPRIVAWLPVNHTEGCSRQRDDDAVILNHDGEPDGFSHHVLCR
jgi:hypothetical protein